MKEWRALGRRKKRVVVKTVKSKQKKTKQTKKKMWKRRPRQLEVVWFEW